MSRVVTTPPATKMPSRARSVSGVSGLRCAAYSAALRARLGISTFRTQPLTPLRFVRGSGKAPLTPLTLRARPSPNQAGCPTAFEATWDRGNGDRVSGGHTTHALPHNATNANPAAPYSNAAPDADPTHADG